MMHARLTPTFLPTAPLMSGLLMLQMLVVAGCSASVGSGSGGFVSTGAQGTPCTPQVQGEGCFWPFSGAPARMVCDATQQTWQVLSQCAPGETCAEWADPSGDKQKKKTGCQAGGATDVIGGDAVVVDAGGDTVGALSDTTQPDTTQPDTTPATSTIAQLNSLPGAKNCTADGSISLLKGVKLSGVVIASPLDPIKGYEAFYIQDKGGGPYSGIYALRAGATGSTPFGQLKMGDVVDLVGNLETYYCLTEFKVTSWNVVGAVPDIAVQVIPVAMIGETASAQNNEVWEGSVVRVDAVVVSSTVVLGDDGKGHGEIMVGQTSADKSLIVTPHLGWGTTFSSNTGPGTWLVSVPVGTAYKSITGVMRWSFGHARLLPFGDASMVKP